MILRLARLTLLTSLLAAAVGIGCGGDGGESEGAELTAVATTTQVGDFLRQVGGDRIEVEQILDPNADPHDYEPRPSDARALAEAALVVKSGGDLDEWTDDLIESAGGAGAVLEVLGSIQTADGQEGEDDPHWWQDPRNAARAVAAIRKALIAADRDGRATYERNAAAYTARLKRLDRSVALCIDSIPAGARKLVTTHDALGYYADRYRLEVVGALIPSLSSQAQPSSKDINELVDQIRAANVRAIFPESSLDPDLEAAVARETGAEVGGALYADTLGPDGSAGETYIGSIQANTQAIVEGLTGRAGGCRPAG